MSAIEILVGDVTDMEAHVYARWAVEAVNRPGRLMTSNVVLQGRVRGPFCAHAKTLPADFEFRASQSDDPRFVMAKALVADPCMWSEDLPHVYDVDVVARLGDEIVAEYHGQVGLRRLAPRRPVDFAPGTG